MGHFISRVHEMTEMNYSLVPPQFSEVLRPRLLWYQGHGTDVMGGGLNEENKL